MKIAKLKAQLSVVEKLALPVEYSWQEYALREFDVFKLGVVLATDMEPGSVCQIRVNEDGEVKVCLADAFLGETLETSVSSADMGAISTAKSPSQRRSDD